MFASPSLMRTAQEMCQFHITASDMDRPGGVTISSPSVTSIARRRDVFVTVGDAHLPGACRARRSRRRCDDFIAISDKYRQEA